MADDFNQACEFALKKLGFKDGFKLREKQLQAISNIISKKDTLVVLPTGYGKSLVYQCLPLVFEYRQDHSKSNVWKSAVLIVSPLNSLMMDQVTKLREKGMEVCIWKVDEVS